MRGLLAFLALLVRDSPFFLGISFSGVGGPANAPRNVALSRRAASCLVSWSGDFAMPLKFTPNPRASNVIKTPSDREAERIFKPYAIEIGKLVYSWNRLQERLARLFVLVCGRTDYRIAAAVWYSSNSDLSQRKMLAAVAEITKFKNSKAQAEITWLVGHINNTLADKRNDVIHTPFVLLTNALGTTLSSDLISENPRARKLLKKELLKEFAWYQRTAEVLSIYVTQIHTAIAMPEQNAWPDRPLLPTLGQEPTPKDKSLRRKPTRLRGLQIRSVPR